MIARVNRGRSQRVRGYACLKRLQSDHIGRYRVLLENAMRRYHPKHQADIPITMDVGIKLSHASMMTDYKKEDWEIAEEAIDEWMRRHDPEGLPLPPTSGYQWKSLFLPDGTVLRTVFGGKNYHCHVENDGIVYQGKPVSPSGFVNAVGGIRRNAWRCTWVLLPSNSEWKLADTLRTRARPRRVRAPVRPAPHPASMPAPPAARPDRAAPETDPIPAPRKSGQPAPAASSSQQAASPSAESGGTKSH